MVITAELNEKLKSAIEVIIPKIMEQLPNEAKAGEPIFTIIVDREAYEPTWFIKLWNEYHVAVITYRKNVKDQWDNSMFNYCETKVLNTNITMLLCEMGTQLNGHWFREIRKLSEDGHQTSIMTTHPSLPLQNTAIKMFARWAQENFFKYMIADFNFDRMIEYGTQAVDQKRSIPNPEYNSLTHKIKKAREKNQELKLKFFNILKILMQ